MKSKTSDRLILSALFLTLGVVLPLFTSQVKEIGDTLLPMHIPVMLCGLICGAKYGFTVGFMLPLVRAILFSMPPLYPNAIWMAFELATYGLVIGMLYWHSHSKTTLRLYICLITAMLAGRIVWGIAKTILLGLGGKAFTFQAFLIGGFLDAIPGIILQLILIPSIMRVVHRAKDFENRNEED